MDGFGNVCVLWVVCVDSREEEECEEDVCVCGEEDEDGEVGGYFGSEGYVEGWDRWWFG